MKRDLFSELRTIYETTASDPHTFRIAIKMKDMVDGSVLRKAVDTTMERYPYFKVRVSADGGTVCFEDNPAPLPVINTKGRIVLGSKETSGHLLAFCWWKNRLFIDAYHGLMDGGGITPMIRTLLYYYCSFYYEKDFSTEGVRLYDSPVLEAEWDDPAAHPVTDKGTIFVPKWEKPAFQVENAGIANLVPDSIVYNVRISEAEFMRFNISNDGSPATIISLLLARTIDALRQDRELPIVIAMCVNQRKALRAPYAHQSLVGDVRLTYTDRISKMPFSAQATCFRGMVSLQSDADMVLDDIRNYQALTGYLAKMSGHEERKSYCVKRMNDLSRCITATVSYVGKANLGDLEHYIQEYEALPSTALPSTHVPLTIEMSALHGYFFINFIQYFHEYDYFEMFIKQLRENNIDYDVLNMTEARFPRVELPV